MSVRERPNSNRFLDLKEKEQNYRTHIRHVKTCKTAIDTKQPELCPRLQIMRRNNTIYRDKQIKYGNMHNRMISDARRPQKKLSDSESISVFTQMRAPPSKRRYSKTSEFELLRQQYQRSRQQSRQSSKRPQQSTRYTEEDGEFLFGQTEPKAAATITESEDDTIKISTIDQEDRQRVFVEQKRNKTKQVLSSDSSSDE